MNTAHAIGVRLQVLGPAVTSQTHLAQYYLKENSNDSADTLT